MLLLAFALVLVFMAGCLTGIAIHNIRVVQGLTDARDYAELHTLAAVRSARRAIDDRQDTLRRVHDLYESRRKVVSRTRRYHVVKLP